eukprot:2843226-Alexandrium_andersonii.AAC.1
MQEGWGWGKRPIDLDIPPCAEGHGPFAHEHVHKCACDHHTALHTVQFLAGCASSIESYGAAMWLWLEGWGGVG